MDIFPNGTVVFQWLLFMAALFALNYGVFRPVRHIMGERRERTQGERNKAAELVRRSEELLRQCEVRLQEARVAGMQEREGRLREGACLEREILQQAKVEIDQTIESMRRKLEQEMRTALLQIGRYGDEIGREIAGRLLGGKS